ncbi:probable glutamate carboxypeptidase LAMP1 [Tanacetum coccineum]
MFRNMQPLTSHILVKIKVPGITVANHAIPAKIAENGYQQTSDILTTAAKHVWVLVLFSIADDENSCHIDYELYVYEIQEIKENKGGAFMWKDQPWKLREMNDRLMMAERALTDREGCVPNNAHTYLQYFVSHQIYAPSKHNRYGSKCFPGIDDALENAKSLNTEDSWLSVQHEIWRVSRVVTQASLVLRGELT